MDQSPTKSTKSEQESWLQTAHINNETILLHPSQLDDVKRNILKELKSRKSRWNDELKGVITKISKIMILNGGVAKIMDDSPLLHY